MGITRMMYCSCVSLAAILGLVVFFNAASCDDSRALNAQIYLPASSPAHDKDASSSISISKEWQLLGPFQIGTREAVWGADPLEYHGGFRNLSYDEEATFASPLADTGAVRWSLTEANVTSSQPENSRAELLIAFPQVDWSFLQSVYGWPALQYQAWVRGYLHLHDSNYQAIAIFTDGILELNIDGHRHFGGDFYSYRRAPLILKIDPGKHVVELRLIRDVRAMGGQENPTISVVLEMELRYEVLSVDVRSLLVPETTGGKLGSTWASVNVQNNAAQEVEILLLDSSNFSLIMKEPMNLAPYQTRRLLFRFAAGSPTSAGLPIKICYRALNEETIRITSFMVIFTDRPLSQPQKFTYIHPAGIASYAILRPPPLDASCVLNQTSTALPIIIALHGAGLEADSAQAREMLNDAYGICAWMLFPSGVTSWSGDDWHTWGMADIQAAVEAIPDWTRAVNWDGPGVSTDDWLVIGHSNGGQAVWFLATHYPDNVLAAAPVSGYTSIENYVPYQLWRNAEPLISSVLHRSRASFKHELLLTNSAGIPILQQHGSDDTNVPAYHSRIMHALLEETGWPSGYVELPHKNHWFQGVMTTAPLLKFYEISLHIGARKLPSEYTIHVPSSGDMSSKGGIHVDQLQSPDRLGRLRVRIDEQQKTWHVQTRNIHRFHLSAKTCNTVRALSLILDGMNPPFTIDPSYCESTWYIKIADGVWTSSSLLDWRTVSQRFGRQVGAMDAILRTDGGFTINTCSAGIGNIALQISRNLLQYFAADSRIEHKCNYPHANQSGNVITLSVGSELPESMSSSYPLHITDHHIILYRQCFSLFGYRHGRADYGLRDACDSHVFDHEPAMGALFLRPLERERLELVVWGADAEGLEQAARLVPTLTGAGQPEFIILSGSCPRMGHGGLYAAGHFDQFWQISAGSYIA